MLKRMQVKSCGKNYNLFKNYNDPLSYMYTSQRKMLSLHGVKHIAIHTACDDGFYTILYKYRIYNKNLIQIVSVDYVTNRPNKIIKLKTVIKKFNYMSLSELLKLYRESHAIVVCTNDIVKNECLELSKLQKYGYTKENAETVINLIKMRDIHFKHKNITDQETYNEGLMALCKQKSLILIVEREFIKVKNNTSINIDLFPNFKKILDEREQYKQHYDLYKFIEQRTKFTLDNINVKN